MRRALIALAVLVFVLAGFAVPLPLIAVRPGAALPVPDYVGFESRPEDELSGRLLMTTVQIEQVAPVGAVEAWLDPDDAVVAQRQVIPEGVDIERYVEAQRQVFIETARLAAALGLRAAGFDAGISGAGARVVAVVPNSPAAGTLRVGDVIVAVDGRGVGLAADLVSALANREVGDRVVLTVKRDGQTVQERVRLGRIPGREGAALGVAVETVDRQITLPFPVEVDAERVGGPSAGMMIALTVYDLADPGDLTRGRTIAGTGTIDVTGDVGPVGGVPQKIAAAVSSGATLFLAPPEEADTARAAARGRLDVIEVGTLQDAIRALRS